MKIEITKDVIQMMVGMFGKEQAIKELQAIINELFLEAVEDAIRETE